MSANHESGPYQNPEMQVLLADVDSAAEAALQDYAIERNLPFEEAHFTQVPGQTFCAFVSKHMITDLTKKGYTFTHPLGERRITYVGWRFDPDGKPLPIDQQPEGSAVIHRFPVIDTDGTPEGRVIADATWQQFLSPEQRSRDLPKVLAGTSEGVRQQLLSWGFNDPQLLRIWERPLDPNKPKPHAV